MKWEKGIVFDLCDINPENISRNYSHDFIRYLDITSVGSGIAFINDEIRRPRRVTPIERHKSKFNISAEDSASGSAFTAESSL